jgi:hypothetical protein
MADALKKELYEKSPDLLLLVSDILNMNDAEIEDLIPSTIMIKIARYQIRPSTPDVEFEEVHIIDKPILRQMESFAIEQDINLEKGWKVEFAKQVKSQLLKLKKNKSQLNF